MAAWAQALKQLYGLLPIVFLALMFPSWAAGEANVRMYTINKKEQQRRINLKNASDVVGCHNMLRAKEVYRFAQVGFAWCSLHSEEECTDESLVSAMWVGREYRKYAIDSSQPQAKLYPGSHWLPQLAEERIKSWYCKVK